MFSGISMAMKSRTEATWLACRIDAARLGFAVEEIVHADHVESELRSVEANHFPIAGEMDEPLFCSSGSCKRNMHGAYRFFFAAAARSGDACNADAEGAAVICTVAVADRVGSATLVAVTVAVPAVLGAV